MFPLIVLLFYSSSVYCDSHSLRYCLTAVSAPGFGIHEYFEIGYVDDQEIVNYNSVSRRMSPRVEWMKMEGAEYWEDSTNRARGNEAVFRFNVKILMERFNQTGGFHSLQWMYGCELGDDGSIRVYDQDGYDGGEFMALDTQTWTYTATMNQAQITAQRWNSPDVQVGERNRNYLENTCIKWLKKYVEYGREDLERRAMMDSPVCLIENTKKGKLNVNEEAIKILMTIEQPAVVVSLVGLYRTGKSYLMNKLAGAKKVSAGFNLGYNVQAETKGIWMGSVPHPTKPNHTLVLLDMESLGDVEKGDNKNDNWIFCLAVFLSSALVYNSMAMIDQDTVDKLKFVGNISEEIKANSQDIEDEEAEFSKHFPIFTWAGRDFHLKLNVDGIEISEDVHLENALKLRERKKTNKDTQYNGLRQCLQMFLSKRKCFVFDQPSLNKEDRQNMENIPDSEMKPEFLRQTKRYYDYVFCKAEVKKVRGITAVTGIQLSELTKMYTNTILTSSMACMEDIAHPLSDMKNKVAVKEAAQHYENMMKERVAFPTDTLDQFLQFLTQYEDEAHQILLQRSFKDNDQKFMKNYMADMVLHKYQASKGSIGINILKSDEALTKKDLEIEAMMDSPVCLIEHTKERKLTLNEEAIKILITIEQPVVVVVVVVSVDVLYQIEKSYLMNKLAAAKKELNELAKMYTSAIMVSYMACMEEIANSLSDMENKMAVLEAAQHYENMMKERVVFPTDTLDQFLQISSQCEDEAHQIFLKRSFRDRKQKFMKSLMELVQEKKNKFCKKNEAMLQETFESVIKKHSVEHKEALAQGSYSIHGGYERFKQDLKAIADKYNMAPGKGVQADMVLQKYQASKEIIGINILKSDEALTKKDLEIQGNFIPSGGWVEWTDSFTAMMNRLVDAELNQKLSVFIMPILIYSAAYISVEHEREELKTFLENCVTMTGIFLIVVITRKHSGIINNIKEVFNRMGSKLIISIENFTQEDHDKTQGKTRNPDDYPQGLGRGHIPPWREKKPPGRLGATEDVLAYKTNQEKKEEK